MGFIGEDPDEIELEPMPLTEPVKEPTPAPAPETQPEEVPV